MYPSIVEEVLLKHEKITEACVFGIAVNAFEQEVCAWVRLKSNEIETSIDEVIKHCEKHLIDYQVPRYVKIVDSFPQSKMGKYLRTEMSARFKNELNL